MVINTTVQIDTDCENTKNNLIKYFENKLIFKIIIGNCKHDVNNRVFLFKKFVKFNEDNIIIKNKNYYMFK
jgi:hypothetical protein